MPFPLFNLSNDNVGTIVSFHYSNACELLRNADAVAYDMRVSEGIPPHTSPEGLFAHMVEGYPTSIKPEDLLDFLNLLPKDWLPRAVFSRLWQYGHLLTKAKSRFEHHHMNPVASDVLAEHTQSMLLDLLVWFKAVSFRAKHRSNHMWSATCLKTRNLLASLGIPKVQATRCSPYGSLNGFHQTVHAKIEQEWLNPNAVILTFVSNYCHSRAMLHCNITSYPQVMSVVDDLGEWNPNSEDQRSKTPKWLVSHIASQVDTSEYGYTDAELEGTATEARISWQWDAATEERSEIGCVYFKTLRGIRVFCEREGGDLCPQRDAWLWPVTELELRAWSRSTHGRLNEQRMCVREAFASIKTRASALGIAASEPREPNGTVLRAVTHEELCAYEWNSGLTTHRITEPACWCERCPGYLPDDADDIERNAHLVPYW